MSADPNLATIATLIGDAARAAMLTALMGGQSLPAGILAQLARISPQTASSHLAKLVEGGLLSVTTSGRHRYYKLSSPQVGEALETLATIAPAGQVRSLRESEEALALRFARTCYDHLAGVVGVAVTQGMLERGFLVLNEQNYEVSLAGKLWLESWQIDQSQLQSQRRNFAKTCLDWSERQPHVAGALGAAITTRLFERKWIVRIGEKRAVRLTEEGRAGLLGELALHLPERIK